MCVRTLETSPCALQPLSAPALAGAAVEVAIGAAISAVPAARVANRCYRDLSPTQKALWAAFCVAVSTVGDVYFKRSGPPRERGRSWSWVSKKPPPGGRHHEDL